MMKKMEIICNISTEEPKEKLIHMETIKIKPVRVSGKCRANLTLNDEILVQGANIENPTQSRMCCNAFGHFPPVINTLQQGQHFFAVITCPDCLPARRGGASVDFLLGHADKWELCLTIATYRQLRENCLEPEAARQLRTAATEHQKRGEFFEATEKTKVALTIMEEAAGVRIFNL